VHIFPAEFVMPITDEMIIAYQSQPAGEAIIETLQLQNDAFTEDVLLATGVDFDISLPLALGQTPLLHIATSINIVHPSHTHEGYTPWRLTVDNVANRLRPYIRAASVGSSPIRVTYRSYTTLDLSQPGDVIPRLLLRNVSLSAIAASGSLSYREIEMDAYPLSTYDESYYPTLQRN
jgi:hypothetical protein